MSGTLPTIIQGGMGAAVSNWRLANAVARRGQMGVISGTGLDSVFVRRLQLGDPDGDLRRAMEHFPCKATVQRVLDLYFIPGGKAPDARFKSLPMFRLEPTREHLAVTILSNFVEVWLAKEGHDGVVGINLLEKIPLPNPCSLYGAMLADVDFVLMGAGIPSQIPGILDKCATHDRSTMRIGLEDDTIGGGCELVFDPKTVFDFPMGNLKRPNFLPIVSSDVLAQALIKRANGSIEGFVVEHHTAGGHNAPPRGGGTRNERGEPVYGARDTADLTKMASFGRPFWLAGSKATPAGYEFARNNGAQGIQVGTLFAFCQESGIEHDLKMNIIEEVKLGKVSIYTDAVASPTGFPFKVAEVEGTLSEASVYEQRTRICDLGYLRRMYRKEDGSIGYRCPSEPNEDYLKKGGMAEDLIGRKCLCNALMANVGVGQTRKNGVTELPLITAGDELVRLVDFIKDRNSAYTAGEVLDYLLAATPASTG